VDLSEQQRAFLEKARGAAMIALRADGTPVAVRVGIVLVDGKIWSSGTEGRARTRWLRRDPRSTLFVYDPTGYAYLNIESRVTILEGPSVPEQSLRLFRAMEKRPTGPVAFNGRDMADDEFLRTMIDEKRLIYEFEPVRVSGL
jgi:hypothetical protein